MATILWRYFLLGYLKVFSLSVCTFVSVLIVSRFKEIARFAALSGDWLKTALFLLYQIPFILPLAIPISALVSSFLLFQRLSRSYELTALRASGLSFKALFSPVLTAAFLLSCLNFSCCADLSPYCWRESKALLYRETSANPLLLMQRQNLVKIKHAYLKMDVKKEGKEANDFLLIAHNESNQRLNLFAAKRLKIDGSKLIGYNLSFLTHLNGKDPSTFDPLCLENQMEMSTEAPALSTALKKNRPRLEPNALSLKMLRLRSELESGRKRVSAKVEMIRRSFLALAVFTFTLLGSAFGIQTSRTPSKKGALYVLTLSFAAIVIYLYLKAIKHHLILALLLAIATHLVILILSIRQIRSVSRGRI